MPPEERPLFDVFPDHNHQEHIDEIDAFVTGEFGQELTPDAAAELQRHRQKHIAFLFGQEMGVLSNGVPDIGGTAGGLGETPNDGLVDEILGEALPESEALPGEGLGEPESFSGSAGDIRRAEEAQ